MQDEEDLDDILDTAYDYRGFGRYSRIRPQQIRGEIKYLTEKVQEQSPQTVVEIGTAKGGTLYIWSRYLNSVDQIVCIDFSLSDGKLKFYNQFETETEIVFVRANSQARETAKTVEETVDEIDFLLIDGDGTYDGVKRDFKNYKPLVSEGGIIAFHDIGKRPDYPNSEVMKFWNEIKEEHESEEIFREPYKMYDGKEVYLGIGIIYV